MRQYPVRGIMDYIEKSKILYNYNDCESLEVANYKETRFLKQYITDPNLTAFLANMAIMYVNQGLLYAKKRLSGDALDNYMIWFDIQKDTSCMQDNHSYTCQVLFSRQARTILALYDNPVNIKDTGIYELIKDIVGFNEFYCYENHFDESDCIQYAFIPKIFVDRYNTDKD